MLWLALLPLAPRVASLDEVITHKFSDQVASQHCIIFFINMVYQLLLCGAILLTIFVSVLMVLVAAYVYFVVY
jgi:hypothetical protein